MVILFPDSEIIKNIVFQKIFGMEVLFDIDILTIFLYIQDFNWILCHLEEKFDYDYFILLFSLGYLNSTQKVSSHLSNIKGVAGTL